MKRRLSAVPPHFDRAVVPEKDVDPVPGADVDVLDEVDDADPALDGLLVTAEGLAERHHFKLVPGLDNAVLGHDF